MPAPRSLAPLYRECAACLDLGDACDVHWGVCSCAKCLRTLARYRARLAALKSDRLLREYDAAISGEPARLLSSRCAT